MIGERVTGYMRGVDSGINQFIFFSFHSFGCYYKHTTMDATRHDGGYTPKGRSTKYM